MNGLDIAILVILAGFAVKGVLRGLLKEVCSLAGLFVGTFLAFRYHGPLAERLMEQIDLPVAVAIAITFTALFLCAMLFFLALGFLLSRFVKLLFLGGFNRLIGGFFGLAQGALLLAVVLFALSLRPLPWIDRLTETSQLAPPFVDLGDAILQGSREVLR
ncbi:MAG TPA: CvpA family protein [Desulfuromonadales bacterium]|nr:CvpA family protein [Desulfuromonadales bacterium]